jgi:hypothetical protein
MQQQHMPTSRQSVPITELKADAGGARGMGVGTGLGCALQGSSPSSYTELARGFSSTKLPPRPFV